MRSGLERSVEEGNNKRFWSRYAKLYDFEVDRFSHRAYERMYQLMSESLDPDMDVLEVATGTGLIALNIAGSVGSVAATDFSPGMIAKASRKAVPANVTFSIEDATSLSFANASFDAVVISNALHIMQNPKLVMENIRRVLKPDGLLIAPTFSHGHLRPSTWDLNARLLRRIGFETYSKWTPEEYVAFIADNGFCVSRWLVLNAAFPLVYLEAHVS
jgi:ubiquinone/menaquinone biosynthesis C-methylase UbiE